LGSHPAPFSPIPQGCLPVSPRPSTQLMAALPHNPKEFITITLGIFPLRWSLPNKARMSCSPAQ